MFLSVFGAQLLLALLLGLLLTSVMPRSGSPNDVMAIVLLAMAVFHLPLGWALGGAAIRAGGRQAALSGTIAAAVLLSIPAWFGVLLLVSGQAVLYLLGSAVVVSIGYSLGFAMTGRAARVAANAVQEEPGT